MKLPITYTKIGNRRRMGVALDDLAMHSGIAYTHLHSVFLTMPIRSGKHFANEKKTNRVILSLEASQALLMLMSVDFYEMSWASWHAISDVINGVTHEK